MSVNSGTNTDDTAMGPLSSPTMMKSLARLLAILDRVHRDHWLKGSTPGIFAAKAIYEDIMKAYGDVVEVTREISNRERGGNQ
jgi:hypothetical protein